MIHKVFAVYDLKACVYLRPIFSVNSGSAIRDFGDEVKNEKSMLCSHPEDFQLFEIGVFDDNSGVLTAKSPTKFLVSANDFAPPMRPAKVGPGEVERVAAAMNGGK